MSNIKVYFILEFPISISTEGMLYISEVKQGDIEKSFGRINKGMGVKGCLKGEMTLNKKKHILMNINIYKLLLMYI